MKRMLAASAAFLLASSIVPTGCDKGGDGSPGGGAEEVAEPQGTAAAGTSGDSATGRALGIDAGIRRCTTARTGRMVLRR